MVYFITGGYRSKEEDERYYDELSETYFKEMDGNSAQTRLVDPTPDKGRRFVDGSPKVGRPLKPDNIPTKIERIGTSLEDLPLLDVEVYASGVILACKAFRDLVEEMEPGVHQFWPMDIVIHGETVARYYWFICCTRISTLSHEHCYPPLSEGGFWRRSPFGQGQNDKVVFSKEKIGTHHAWVDSHYSDRLFSNEFAARARALNLTGLKYHEMAEV